MKLGINNGIGDMQRLHSSEDIQSVWNSVRPYRVNGFLIRMQKSAELDHRVGVIIPKKYVAKAVDRNLMKRRMREAIRRWLYEKNLYHQEQKYDILVVLSGRDEPRSMLEYTAFIDCAAEVFVR